MGERLKAVPSRSNVQGRDSKALDDATEKRRTELAQESAARKTQERAQLASASARQKALNSGASGRVSKALDSATEAHRQELLSAATERRKRETVERRLAVQAYQNRIRAARNRQPHSTPSPLPTTSETPEFSENADGFVEEYSVAEEEENPELPPSPPPWTEPTVPAEYVRCLKQCFYVEYRFIKQVHRAEQEGLVVDESILEQVELASRRAERLRSLIRSVRSLPKT
eukprot:gnl/Spiro4/21101_TR10291_c0_g1_i1.p2 gnl/Spiro4/21101_TR10291_c0_g1~~gnl/Spiro4/21101_TR10291_c0_g1_i1.p2  ORF type:complete len:229 (-),score=23.30 gnl/Spiro4/21101_TR10291_c0_g1_i1:62-748(-)